MLIRHPQHTFLWQSKIFLSGYPSSGAIYNAIVRSQCEGDYQQIVIPLVLDFTAGDAPSDVFVYQEMNEIFFHQSESRKMHKCK